MYNGCTYELLSSSLAGVFHSLNVAFIVNPSVIVIHKFVTSFAGCPVMRGASRSSPVGIAVQDCVERLALPPTFVSPASAWPRRQIRSETRWMVDSICRGKRMQRCFLVNILVQWILFWYDLEYNCSYCWIQLRLV